MKASIGLGLTYKNLKLGTVSQQTDELVTLSFCCVPHTRSGQPGAGWDTQNRVQQLSTEKPCFLKSGRGLEVTKEENRGVQRESLMELGLSGEENKRIERGGR